MSKLKFVRMLNPGGIDQIKDWLMVGEEFVTIDDVADALKQLLQSKLQDCFYLVAYDSSETADEIAGFLIAFIQGNHVTLFQLWSKDQETTLKDKMFGRLLLWAETTEINVIRFSTARVDQLVLAKWKPIPQFTMLEISTNGTLDALLDKA